MNDPIKNVAAAQDGLANTRGSQMTVSPAPAAAPDTPRTDEQLVRPYDGLGLKSGTVVAATARSGHPTFVPSEFARILERENADLRRELERLQVRARQEREDAEKYRAMVAGGRIG